MKYLYIAISFFAPATTLAQNSFDLGVPTSLEKTDKTFAGLVYGAGDLFQTLFVTIIGASFLVFLFGLTRSILKGGDDGVTSSKAFMVWGVVGLFVSLTIFGILQIARNTVVGL